MVCDLCLQTAPGKSRKAMCKLLFSSPRQTDNKEGGRRLCMGSWLEGIQFGMVGSAARHEHKAGVVEEQKRELTLS